jgi:hypothetical protein
MLKAEVASVLEDFLTSVPHIIQAFMNVVYQRITALQMQRQVLNDSPSALAVRMSVTRHPADFRGQATVISLPVTILA